MVTAESGENKDKTSERNGFKIYSVIIIIILSITIALLILFVGLYLLFGLYTPFFKVASDSMMPTLEVEDTIVVSGLVSFSQLKVGDIIVFTTPSNNDRIIVHRIIDRLQTQDTEIILRTQGDASPNSIDGLDYPVREHNYIGKVVYHISNKDPFFSILKPPVIHIIILVTFTGLASALLYTLIIRGKNN